MNPHFLSLVGWLVGRSVMISNSAGSNISMLLSEHLFNFANIEGYRSQKKAVGYLYYESIAIIMQLRQFIVKNCKYMKKQE